MNEGPKKRRFAKWTLIALFALGLALLALVWLFRRGDALMFKIVDADTGLPVTNVSVSVYREWTRLPVQKLRVDAISPWTGDSIVSRDGTFDASKIPKSSDHYLRIMFSHPEYHAASFMVVDDGYQVGSAYHPHVTLPRTNHITITLHAKVKPAASGK